MMDIFGKIKKWYSSRKNSRIIMVMHPKIYFPKGKVFEFRSISWTSYEGSPIELTSKWKVIKHIDHVHIKIRPIDINKEYD